MEILGVTDHRWLGDQDARIRGSATRRYGASTLEEVPDDALALADLGEIAADVATVISITGADGVVGYDENGGDGHPDRVRTQDAARRAARVMDVPYYSIVTVPAPTVPSPTVGDAGVPDGIDPSDGIDVSSVLDRKRAALSAYRSRFTVHGSVVVAPDGTSRPIAAVEGYRPSEADGKPAATWSELGAGWRIVGLTVALIGGIAIGALGTVVFQSGITVAGLEVPAGLIAALAVAAAILSGLRLVFRSRLMPGSAAVGMLGIISLLSLESSGGSVLIPVGTLSYYWIYGPVVIALLVLGWPNLGRPNDRHSLDRRRPLIDSRPRSPG